MNALLTQTSQPCQFERDCPVVMIPSGEEVVMPEGTIAYITQSLGGSFTVFVDGSLFRVSGADADAIGKPAVRPPELPENATEEDLEKLVWAQMRTCYDPEIPVNIVDLGLIYACSLERGPDGQHHVSVSMTLTAPGCGMGEILVEDVRSRIALIPTIGSVDVQLVFEPPWNYQMMSEAARLETGMF